MKVKTFGKGLRFVLVLAFLPSAAPNLWSKAPGSKREDAESNAHVTISVYNDAEVPANVLSQAEQQAEQVFRHAGIEVTWLHCRVPAVSEEASQACREAFFPEHLHLRIVPQSLGLKGDALGIAFQEGDGIGCYADLFYEPMQNLSKSDGTDIASLLGHVAAHEIGHLLLGTNSHSATGIMHAHWTAKELASVKVGGLVFLEKESLRMKARLITAMQASKKATAETNPRAGD